MRVAHDTHLLFTITTNLIKSAEQKNLPRGYIINDVFFQTKSPSVHDQVEALIKHISKGPKWRFHGLLRACVETGQEYVISEIYHLDPADYKLPEDCDVGRQETHL